MNTLGSASIGSQGEFSRMCEKQGIYLQKFFAIHVKLKIVSPFGL